MRAVGEGAGRSMETNRKHNVSGPLQPLRAVALGSSPGDPAHRFWSRPPLSQRVIEATWATARALEGEPVKAICGELEVDRAKRRATLAGSDLPLTRREYALLLYLVDRTNRLVSRSELLEKIWALEDDYGANVLQVYIRRLRQKFGAHAHMIETIRGLGYCLRPPRAT